MNIFTISSPLSLFVNIILNPHTYTHTHEVSKVETDPYYSLKNKRTGSGGGREL